MLASLKKEWAEFNPRGKDIVAYSVQVGRIGEDAPREPVGDNVLTFAWI
ncbi:hypothetical protein AS9A_P20113 (plasmid) [Hoyosella subflava DQS3-9A1]|uniref:Uncharacterized protein n=1 Tax=Hoyosella subflava (strain DSM 45089 / JCM 17490 / NBRC 109087 / DQS3-9A1) TaxID=443218 RepID=F6ESN6_HOYSD|nr:hypothetical protein AS9A_P20113 [Hoyosella subflava DQS3-9A1]